MHSNAIFFSHHESRIRLAVSYPGMPFSILCMTVESNDDDKGTP